MIATLANIRATRRGTSSYPFLDFSDKYCIRSFDRYSSAGLLTHPERNLINGDTTRSEYFIAKRNFTKKFSFLEQEIET